MVSVNIIDPELKEAIISHTQYCDRCGHKIRPEVKIDETTGNIIVRRRGFKVENTINPAGYVLCDDCVAERLDKYFYKSIKEN